MLYAMIMAGGSGTRLWPLSRRNRPKQTIPLIANTSLYQQAVGRLEGLVTPENIFTVSNASYAQLLQEQEPSLPAANFLIEPEGRGTAAAIGLAAIHLRQRDPAAVMMVVTADHAIQDEEGFRAALRSAAACAAEGWLVTLGITPSFPATGFGYIQQGEKLPGSFGADVWQVERFVEKPDAPTARRMLEQGGFSWNSGMFIWQVARILEEFRQQMPALAAQLAEIEAAIGTPHYEEVLRTVWPHIQKQTIDYGVMEHAGKVAVIPAEIGWHDVGTWSSLYEVLPADEEGNRWSGPHLEIDSRGILAVNRERLVAVVGLENVVIVDTPDALLVCPREREQEVRRLVELLQERGWTEWL